MIKAITRSLRGGLGFGLTSGVVTTLGLIVGLHSGTHSKIVIIGGILTIAVADAFSDALGIHISEESEKGHAVKEIWEATFATFFSKLVIALTFIFPVLFFNLISAILISVLWGLFLIGLFSFYTAKQHHKKPRGVILEHILIAGLVIIITHYIGDWVATLR